MKTKRKKKLEPKKRTWHFPNAKVAGEFADSIQTKAPVTCHIGSPVVDIHDDNRSEYDRKARKLGAKTHEEWLKEPPRATIGNSLFMSVRKSPKKRRRSKK